MSSMAIPAEVPDTRPVCRGCGWHFTPQPPLTSRVYCEVCHGLNQDVAKWVQTHPARPRPVQWADLGRLLGGVAMYAAMTGALLLAAWLLSLVLDRL